MKSLILASTSPARKLLLERLGLAFQVAPSRVDETPLPGESPLAMVQRLARAKAEAVARAHAASLIIGADQVGVVAGEILGKPADHADAVRQLQRASGNSVTFLTALCLLNSATKNIQLETVPYSVTFRALTDEQIENYLRLEQPYHCALSFKSEGLGVALCEKYAGDDPTALIGLPLIRLVRMLEREGLHLI
ncbi:MAG: Maf family nucleotide pyrophosphatase [Gammaproteobacteria bacterium]|nr:Maf family nucleotide pyrophosphatase [Gammaproteobacteria bacterium]